MSRSAPYVVSTRLTKAQLSALDRVARSRQTTRAGVLVHAAVSLMSLSAATESDGLFRDLLAALGVDPDSATTEQIETALEPLIDAIALPDESTPEGNDDPLASAADPLHPASSDEAAAEGDAAARGVAKTVRKLSAAELAAKKDATARAVREELSARGLYVDGSRLVRLNARDIAAAKAKGLTPEQLIAARQNAAVRIGGRK